MRNGGECLCCEKVSRCFETSVERILSSYTCPLFEAVPEPIFRARLDAMSKFGEMSAAEAMMNRPEQLEEGEEK